MKKLGYYVIEFSVNNERTWKKLYCTRLEYSNGDGEDGVRFTFDQLYELCRNNDGIYGDVFFSGKTFIKRKRYIEVFTYDTVDKLFENDVKYIRCRKRWKEYKNPRVKDIMKDLRYNEFVEFLKDNP